MPNYSSKSQKRSQSQSKNGGRRKKRTLKNVRRRKSRKVMRGGADDLMPLLMSNDAAFTIVQKYTQIKPGLTVDTLKTIGKESFNNENKIITELQNAGVNI